MTTSTNISYMQYIPVYIQYAIKWNESSIKSITMESVMALSLAASVQQPPWHTDENADIMIVREKA